VWQRGDLVYKFWWRDLMETHLLEDLGVDGSIMLKPVFRKVGWGGTDWTDLAEDRDRWRALVKAVMNLRVPQNSENFFDLLKNC
jgi:hypothetical protein